MTALRETTKNWVEKEREETNKRLGYEKLVSYPTPASEYPIGMWADASYIDEDINDLVLLHYGEVTEKFTYGMCSYEDDTYEAFQLGDATAIPYWSGDGKAVGHRVHAEADALRILLFCRDLIGANKGHGHTNGAPDYSKVAYIPWAIARGKWYDMRTKEYTDYDLEHLITIARFRAASELYRRGETEKGNNLANDAMENWPYNVNTMAEWEIDRNHIAYVMEDIDHSIKEVYWYGPSCGTPKERAECRQGHWSCVWWQIVEYEDGWVDKFDKEGGMTLRNRGMALGNR